MSGCNFILHTGAERKEGLSCATNCVYSARNFKKSRFSFVLFSPGTTVSSLIPFKLSLDVPLNGLVTRLECVLVSIRLSTLQQLTEIGWIEVRNSYSAVVTHPTALSQNLSLFSNSQLGGNQLPAKPNYSTFANVHRLWLQFTPAVLCNLQIAFVLLSGGIFGPRPSLTERDVCLPQSNWVIPQIASLSLPVENTATYRADIKRLRRGWEFSQYGSRRISLL